MLNYVSSECNDNLKTSEEPVCITQVSSDQASSESITQMSRHQISTEGITQVPSYKKALSEGIIQVSRHQASTESITQVSEHERLSEGMNVSADYYKTHT